MNDPLPTVRATAQPTGLIDTLQAGFDLVNHNAWLLSIPIAIDLVMWLGPQVTLGSLAQRWASDLAALVPAAAATGGTTEQYRQSLAEVVRQAEGLSRYNVLSFLAVPLLGLPSFQAGAAGRGATIEVGAATMAAVLLVGLTAAGLCLAALFYGMLGQAVRDGRASPSAFVHRFGDTVGRLAGLFGVLLAALVGLGLPVILVVALIGAAAPLAGSVLASVLLGVMLWALIYLFFATDAVYVSSLPPMAALRSSIRVVRGNFWSALGLIVLIVVISGGLSIMWTGISRQLHEPGTGLAIFGHIYISTGLAAASMTYYKERFDRMMAAHDSSSGVVGGGATR